MDFIKLRLVVAFMLFFVTHAAQAEFWSGQTKVTKVYPYNDGLIFFTQYANTEVSTCDRGTRFSISKSHPNYEVMVSTLLAAFMSDKSLTMNVASTAPSCMPTINRFIVI